MLLDSDSDADLICDACEGNSNVKCFEKHYDGKSGNKLVNLCDSKMCYSITVELVKKYTTVVLEFEQGSDKDKDAKRKLAALDSTLTTKECEKAESRILTGVYTFKHHSLPENYDKHNSVTHCWHQLATLDQEGIKIITP
ncbi:hypothetical protein BC830DRAFT_1079019 [Chytriomyces sp. MP71]|nr:hypothetical protein BC830DRAFT_1079019 [Chytriomyces sp. MP71]